MTIKASSTPTPEKVSREDYVKRFKSRVLETFQLDPVVTITLKGHDYTLEFNNWAVKEILRESGVNMIATGFTSEHMQSPEIMSVVLYYGLKTHHSELTQDGVDRMFTLRHYPYIHDRLSDAVDLFLPDMSDMEIEKRAEGEANPGDPTSPPIQAG